MSFWNTLFAKPTPLPLPAKVSNFLPCMAEIFREEGAFSNHVKDNGGATMYGVTRATLAAYRGHPVSVDEVRMMTREEARAIYMSMYWNPIRGDELPRGVDLCVFDACVNSGPNRAAKWLQGSVPGVEIDGSIGPRTLAAVRMQTNHSLLIQRYCDRRMNFLRSHEDWPTFGKGWTNRVERVEATAIKWTNK